MNDDDMVGKLWHPPDQYGGPDDTFDIKYGDLDSAFRARIEAVEELASLAEQMASMLPRGHLVGYACGMINGRTFCKCGVKERKRVLAAYDRVKEAAHDD